MFKKILVANRGEIARRVIHACREMGVETAAVYSEADEKALHVLEASEAVSLGPSEPSQSYLNIDKIVEAVKKTGAEAVHPGYGFLAENARFAKRIEEEGVVFIGPPSAVIRDLGDKIVARRIMKDGGVPITPGMIEPGPDPARVAAEADKIGYPVLIKAAAGGGGKGIRIVNSGGEIADALAGASSEAKSAFGDGSVYVEKFFPKARHIEFQILADSHGNAIHLWERECSIQRRHQKIIEESPANVMTPELREKMGQAAVAAARASGYVNAGTVEFLVDEKGDFYFLEVNTRLQVEHPVTEMITGIDIVRKQLEIASGEKLGIRQEDVMGRGHAIECRLYAEDPRSDFMPSPGKIKYYKEPAGPGVRVDGGVYSGFEVPVDYDPIVSKLIVHGEDRDKAIARMIKALGDYVVLGVTTPIPFMIDVLNSEAFRGGDIFTDFIPRHFADWKPANRNKREALIAFVADELSGRASKKPIAAGKSRVPSPFDTLGNWRL